MSVLAVRSLSIVAEAEGFETLLEAFESVEGDYGHSFDDYLALPPGCFFSNGTLAQKEAWREAYAMLVNHKGEEANRMLAGELNALGDYVTHSGDVLEAHEMLDCLGNTLYYGQDSMPVDELVMLKVVIARFRLFCC